MLLVGIKKNYMKILCLSPHTDDSELGCGGTIARLIEEGHDVKYVAFSYCGNADLKLELQRSSSILNVDVISCMNNEVRNFNINRQGILDNMIELRNIISPDIVFMPCKNDLHQDHCVIYEEGLRAFKNCTIYGYELIWNNLVFNAQSFFKLEERHINKKIHAIKEYTSQSHRNYMDSDFIRSLAKVRGTQIGCEYAESFELIRLIQ